MPGTTCAVYGCKNNTKKTAQSNISFFTFPKDTVKQQLWTLKCNRGEKFNTRNARICSDHFTQADYIDDIDLTSSPGAKRKLKENAVPSRSLLKGMFILINHSWCCNNSFLSLPLAYLPLANLPFPYLPFPSLSFP